MPRKPRIHYTETDKALTDVGSLAEVKTQPYSAKKRSLYGQKWSVADQCPNGKIELVTNIW
jgi:hypothetical protein